MEEVKYGRLTVFADNIEEISNEALNSLECGDCVVKFTYEGGKKLKHTYVVTHKQDTGICMTYVDAGYMETVSYDCVDGEWTFNSKDVAPVPSDEHIGNVAKETVEGAESGTISNVLGLDSEGGLVKGTVSGGTKLYKHFFFLRDANNDDHSFIIITTFANSFTELVTSGGPTRIKVSGSVADLSNKIISILQYDFIQYTGVFGSDSIVLVVYKINDFNNPVVFSAQDITDTVTEL